MQDNSATGVESMMMEMAELPDSTPTDETLDDVENRRKWVAAATYTGASTTRLRPILNLMQSYSRSWC